ncbi:biotin-dependent carboxyltransferase family protein [Nocardia brasiliensis]|uniref:5-oxoprolinase subunit C family protein n=1 Tax=Nocardia brasiliensis TaxID=37326 RepID=UPI002457722D|nr:biotin-dependent carboxyltransferase family protein [Nocardia brasiliensis]
MVTVETAGAHTLVQDLGRDGYYAMGLPPSGALDQFSHRCANLLVGNHPSAATLEVTMVGPALRCDAPTHVAVTGGDVPVWIDGVLQENWTTLRVASGRTLTVGTLRTGCRAYIAIRGGIDTPPFLGSRSTYVSSAIGGLRGAPIRTGDELPIGLAQSGACPGPGSAVDSRLRPTLAGGSRIRVVPGLCHYRFDEDSVERFFSSVFTVSPVSDRTGYRLHGPALTFVEREPPFGAGDNPSNVVDLGYPMGSIQIPNGEEPICLLRDAVTGGGYATIGTVISGDLDRIAQLKAPDAIRFVPISLNEAMAARKLRKQKLREVEFGLKLFSIF